MKRQTKKPGRFIAPIAVAYGKAGDAADRELGIPSGREWRYHKHLRKTPEWEAAFQRHLGRLVTNRRRRLRRNPGMSTSTMLGIGAAAVVAFFLLRPGTRTVMTAAGPVVVPENIVAATGLQRETEVARIMARNPRLTRAEADARYDRAIALISGFAASMTRPAVSGLGSYYRS